LYFPGVNAALLEKLYDNQIKAKELGQKQFGKTSRFLPVLNEVSENLTVTQNEQIERMINRNATEEEFLSYYENQGIIPKRAVKQKPTAISTTDEVTEAPEKIEGPATRQRRLETEKVITEKSADVKLKTQQKDIDTSTEDLKVAGDLKIVGKQMYDIANNPLTQSMFGKLANTRIQESDLSILQHNLVMSHCTGVGNLLDNNLVKLIAIIKVASLGRGYSGVRYELLESLLNLINHEFYPCIPTKGSVGASGDLAPLAHLVSPLIGVGYVRKNDHF
jgi:hypothetical protein